MPDLLILHSQRGGDIPDAFERARGGRLDAPVQDPVPLTRPMGSIVGVRAESGSTGRSRIRPASRARWNRSTACTRVRAQEAARATGGAARADGAPRSPTSERRLRGRLGVAA